MDVGLSAQLFDLGPYLLCEVLAGRLRPCMKYLLLFFFVFAPFSCIAECYENLSQGQDSVSYQISTDELNGDMDRIDVASKAALTKLFSNLGCVENSVLTFNCRRLLKKQPESDVCYARSDYGYFIMSKDYLGHVNIVFNRFD